MLSAVSRPLVSSGRDEATILSPSTQTISQLPNKFHGHFATPLEYVRYSFFVVNCYICCTHFTEAEHN